MGRLYDAVNKARDRRFDDGLEESDFAGQAPEQFDFIQYSLGARPMLGMGRSQREAAAMVRHSVIQPACEVNIDARDVDPHLVAFHHDRRANEQYNKLAISLISKAAERSFRRVLITSANHGEGRTSTALNLACALARAKQRVLIVDCDLSSPATLRLLGARCEIGLEEALARGLGAGAAVTRIMPYRFDVLPVLRPVDNPAEVLAAPAFWKTLQMLDTGYDFVLFDSSPLLDGPDSNLLLRYTDTTLLVVRPGATTSTEMARAIAPFTQEDFFGVLINRAEDKGGR